MSLGGDDPEGLIDRALQKVAALIDCFDDPATPYRVVPDPRIAPRFSDYRHLEWRDEAEIDPEAEP